MSTKNLLFASVLLWSTSALAAPRGVVIAPAELSSAHRRQIRRQVAQAHRSAPAAFKALTALRARLPQIAARQRGRHVTVLLPLRSLGPDALMPMLAELAVAGGPRGDLSDRAWRGWRVSLLEAVGSLRDVRARAVLEAILAGKSRDPGVYRAAATALARLGDDRAVSTLLRIARQDPATRLAVVPALGECRRARVARELAAILRMAGDDGELTVRAIAALGQVGNAWAWETPAVSKSGEGDDTRRAAMDALLAWYPGSHPIAGEAAFKALMLIGHPQTRAAITTARGKASGARRRALSKLGDRLRRTTHRY